MPVVQSCNVHHTNHLGRGEEGEREEGGMGEEEGGEEGEKEEEGEEERREETREGGRGEGKGRGKDRPVLIE